MIVEVRSVGEVVIVDLNGRLVAGEGDQQLRAAIDELLSDGRRKIVLNLAQVDAIDSSGVGELVAGSRPGRTTPGEITLYKSVGVAVQDLAAAALVLAAARDRGVGLEIELEEIHV